MLKAVMCVLALAVSLTILVVLLGYIDYRKEMNACLNSGGILVKSSTGLKCVPRGSIRYI